MNAFDQAMTRQVAPILEARGFVRRGQNWSRRERGAIEVVSFQRSMYNTRRGARFTVNIGVTPDLVSSHIWVAEPECRWRKRIGALRPEAQDHWYSYLPDDPASVQAAVTEALDDIEAYVLPYLATASPMPLAMRIVVGIWQGVRILFGRSGGLRRRR